MAFLAWTVTSQGNNSISYGGANPLPLNLNGPNWVMSTIRVSGFPVPIFDGTVSLGITMDATFSDPSSLKILLLRESSYIGAYLSYFSRPSVSCPEVFTTTFFDDQPNQAVDQGSFDIASCPPLTLTAVGTVYQGDGGSTFPMTPTTTPFAQVYSAQTINTVWTLALYSTSAAATGTVYSWSIEMIGVILAVPFWMLFVWKRSLYDSLNRRLYRESLWATRISLYSHWMERNAIHVYMCCRIFLERRGPSLYW